MKICDCFMGCIKSRLKSGGTLQIEVDETAVPYAGKLEGLTIGDIVTVQGLVHPECERFSVNLCCMKFKDDPDPDLAFHFNPRLSQRYIVRNTKFSGRWGKEETAACFPFPFKRGEAFTIDIFISDDSYLVQVNSAHFCVFPFRTTFERVTELQVRGTGVSVGVVRRGLVRSYPARSATSPQPPIVPKCSEDINIDWGNPAIGILQEGLQRGRQLVILGRIKLLPHSFYINLQSSVQMWPHPEIPLHVNPRFMASRKHVIIRNSWQQGSWGDEERMETAHLSPGTKFELKINVEDDQYSLWSKDNLIGIFKFRMSPDCVRAILIQGDVEIHRIYQQDVTSQLIMCDDF